MGIEDTSKQSCDDCRWVKKAECHEKQKEKGGGEGGRARVGFAWLDWWLELILRGQLLEMTLASDSVPAVPSAAASGLIFTQCPQGLQADGVLLGFLHFHLLIHIQKQGFEIQLGCNFYCKCNYKCKVSKYISQVMNSKPGTVLSWWNISCPDLSHVLIKLI